VCRIRLSRCAKALVHVAREFRQRPRHQYLRRLALIVCGSYKGVIAKLNPIEASAVFEERFRKWAILGHEYVDRWPRSIRCKPPARQNCLCFLCIPSNLALVADMLRIVVVAAVGRCAARSLAWVASQLPETPETIHAPRTIFDADDLKNPVVYDSTSAEIVNIVDAKLKYYLNEHGYTFDLTFPHIPNCEDIPTDIPLVQLLAFLPDHGGLGIDFYMYRCA
jgi:hypothetical protein